MDQETCETVRQLCMLAAHEQSEENLTSLVGEIYRLVAAAGADDEGLRKPAGVSHSSAKPGNRIVGSSSGE